MHQGNLHTTVVGEYLEQLRFCGVKFVGGKPSKNFGLSRTLAHRCRLLTTECSDRATKFYLVLTNEIESELHVFGTLDIYR